MVYAVRGLLRVPPCFPLERFPPACLAGLPEFLEGGSSASEVERTRRWRGACGLGIVVTRPRPLGALLRGGTTAGLAMLPSLRAARRLVTSPDFLPLNPLLGPPLPLTPLFLLLPTDGEGCPTLPCATSTAT